MRQTIFILTLTLFINTLNAQERKVYYENGNLKTLLTVLEGNAQKIIKYSTSEYYLNGELRETGETDINGPLGEWKGYHDNGQLRYTIKFINGQQSGDAKFYFENGLLEEVTNWDNGTKVGESKTYYDTGKIESIGNYLSSASEKSNDDGPMRYRGDGEFKDYYENGQLKSIYYYDHGVRTGIWKYFDETGKLVETKNY